MNTEQQAAYELGACDALGNLAVAFTDNLTGFVGPGEDPTPIEERITLLAAHPALALALAAIAEHAGVELPPWVQTAADRAAASLRRTKDGDASVVMRTLAAASWTFGWHATGEAYITGRKGDIVVGEMELFNAHREAIFAELERQASEYASEYGPMPAGTIATLRFTEPALPVRRATLPVARR